MPRRRCQGLRGTWTGENLTLALAAVSEGMSLNRASITYAIPRRTLRRYVAEGKQEKSSLGRKTILTSDQEAELTGRIHRLAEIGYPLTSRVLRRCVYRYAHTNNIVNPFRRGNEMAGRYWLRGFLKRNPRISPRKAQNLNPARAQKLNKFIVNDHFTKLEAVLKELDIIDKPERIYNVDEKGCRLSLHHQQKVLAKKGARRVHIVAKEHGESVTIVSCGNALGTVIPAMILFKGKRMKPEWLDDLPPGATAHMTPKGSMNIDTFSLWLQHFAKFKVPGPCIIIFDGAKCHLDDSIVITADKYDITLYCLPSNTTHELQPMDKAVFRAFEYYWDDEVMKYFSVHRDRTITKQRFGTIFSTVWDKTMTPANIKSGFAATGIYPFNRDAIPEVAFAPSTITHQENEEQINVTSAERIDNPVQPESAHSDAVPSTSGLQQRKRLRQSVTPDESSNSDSSDFSVHDSSEEGSRSDHGHSPQPNVSFTEMLTTPEGALTRGIRTNRKPAMNSRAQVVKVDLFNKQDKTQSKLPKGTAVKKSLRSLKKSTVGRNSATSRAPKDSQKQKTRESWYCPLCDEDRIADMRLCNACSTYMHEECLGLTAEDEIEHFICPECNANH